MASWLLRLVALAPLALLAGLATSPVPAQVARSRTYTFCFWNVENFFDDRPNPKLEKVDREFDEWYARDPDVLKHKLERIGDVLLSRDLNGGNGPDILALAEIESQRAVELIRDELNGRIRDKNLHYRHLAYRDPQGGRSIATALLSRVPLVGTPRLLGRNLRILETRIGEDKHTLTIVASHWTSRVSDKTGRGRSGYARLIYDEFYSLYRKDPLVDFLVCGDFNDTPTDDSLVNDLGSVGDVKKILSLAKGDKPQLFNPFEALARKGKGTHFFGERPFVFDQIVLSPGLLDGEGWSYVNNSAIIVEKMQFRGRPDRFGGPADRRPWRNRGASDHFPVLIQLRVNR
ncbi:MAG: endonuclease/exonuclease/phosphatase family protein [Gemmataceae bacterium]